MRKWMSLWGALALLGLAPLLLAQVATFPRYRLGGGASGKLAEVDSSGNLQMVLGGTAAANADAGYATFPRFRLAGGATGNLAEVDSSGQLLVSINGGSPSLTSLTLTGTSTPCLRVDTTTLTVDCANHRVGIGTAAPSVDLGFGGDAARTISLERHTTANTAGNGMALWGGGATLGATDKDGGNLFLVGGTATGTGSSSVIIQTATPQASTNTTDNTPSTKVTILGSGNVGIGHTTPSARLVAVGGQLLNENASGTFATSKFNSQGVAWSAFGTTGLFPSLIFQSDSSVRPEIAWLRGSRTYPEFAIRQHTTSDKGGEIYAGGGTSAPTLVASILATGLGLFNTAPAIPLDTIGLVGTSDTGNAFATSKFDSQGVAWSSRTSQGSYILQGATGTRPEIAWYRGSRTYPEFALREHTTADTGGEVYAGPGTAAPTKVVQYTVNGMLNPLPTTQVIAATNTIAADACGGTKLISSASAVTTNTTNTITAPAATNQGCHMHLCNVNASDAITLDKNANILLVGGADVALGAGCCIDVVSTGASGVWKQTTAQLCSS